MTVDVPDEPGDFRQVSLRWNQEDIPFECSGQGCVHEGYKRHLEFHAIAP